MKLAGDGFDEAVQAAIESDRTLFVRFFMTG